MEISIERKIEIEREFSKLLDIFENRDKALKNMISEIRTIEESEYLYEVYLMPFEEISREIKKYDSSFPRSDAGKFVDNLCERYKVDRKTVVNRIQNVRRVNRYLNEKDKSLVKRK